MQWLALKLTAEGYRVWCDRLKLLGGESYPEDIDCAIRERTFRFLAVISQNSVHKPNPRKERTLALNLARERDQDFVLPLNLDGVGPTELGWMLSDLTYIPFDRSWADGLAQLLEKLQSINAPRPLSDGKSVVADWLGSRDAFASGPERVWTNLLPIEEMPDSLIRVRAANGQRLDIPEGWPVAQRGENVFWAFELPDSVIRQKPADLELIRWDAPGLWSDETPSRHRHTACAKLFETESTEPRFEANSGRKASVFPTWLAPERSFAFPVVRWPPDLGQSRRRKDFQTGNGAGTDAIPPLANI